MNATEAEAVLHVKVIQKGCTNVEKTLNYAETMEFSNGTIFNSGTELWAMDSIVRLDHGYIAIGGRRSDDDNMVHRFNEGKDGSNSIQILSFAIDAGIGDLGLYLSIDHNHGNVRDLHCLGSLRFLLLWGRKERTVCKVKAR